MLPVHDDATNRSPQNQRDKLRELSITKHGRLAELSCVNLFENLAGRSQRFGKHCLLVADRIRNNVQIFEWKSQIFRERAVVRHDAKHGPSRAMCFHSAPQKEQTGR